MKKRLFALFIAMMYLLTACGQTAPGVADDGKLTIVATTYPVYLFASAVTAGAENIVVERLDTGSTSCLHDYNLTVNDMKKLEKADVIALSGVGLEEFMEDALATSEAMVIDCSEGVKLLENQSHHHDEHDHSHDGHDHGHFDPHYWLDPDNAILMAENLAAGLTAVEGGEQTRFENNAARVRDRLPRGAYDCHRLLDGVGSPELITFHDGFQYFSHAFEMNLLESIEEEAGSEASAKEIVEITALVKDHGIPGIFTEVNGSDATANAIARETGCQVAQLSMLMDGSMLGPNADVDDWIDLYLDGLTANVETVAGVFAGA
ncbi:MAG: metal ABC transporter substrate-binding protein [Clostridium sp.]|nr:metal ABC transporter substrate-binding protein [Clostridium sp.]